MSNDFKIGDQVYVSDRGYKGEAYGKVIAIENVNYKVELQNGESIIVNPNDLRLSGLFLPSNRITKIDNEDLRIEPSQMTHLFEEEQRKCEAQKRLINMLEQRLQASLKQIVTLENEVILLGSSLAQMTYLFEEEQRKSEKLEESLGKMRDDRNYWMSEHSVLSKDYESLQSEVNDLRAKHKAL
jgi:chromosome segregation ATPase